MRMLHTAIVTALLLTSPALADTASEELLVPVGIGTIIRAPLELPSGGVRVVELQVAGTSPDDYFNYWVGYYQGAYYGYDRYAKLWRSGPAGYRKAMLRFQGEGIYGFVRSFAGVPDTDRFFSEDGVVFERFNNAVGDRYVYSYFVNAATGQRSDAGELGELFADMPQVAQAIAAEQALQQEDYLAAIAERDPDYPYWQVYGSILPDHLPSVVTWQAPAKLSGDLADNQLTLLELIEEEIGPLEEAETAPPSGATPKQ